MIKSVVSLATFIALLVGCNSDPSVFKVPKPDREIKDNTGKISTFNPAVDILFIIDDSGSMQDFQDRLAMNADTFIDQFFNAPFIDYHIGVTSSSYTSGGSKAPNGKLHKVDGHTYVTRNTPDGADILARMMNVGTGGSATERFLSIPQKTFSKLAMKGSNKGFFREEAQLLIFFLTDSIDQSFVTPEDSYKFLLELKKGNPLKLHAAAAIVTIKKWDCQANVEPDKKRVKFRKFIKLFQSRGHRFNLCQENYGDDLARVARNVVDAASTVYLDNVPDITTMEVLYGKQRIPNTPNGGWTYDFDLNAIHLSPEIDVQGGAGQMLKILFEEIYRPMDPKTIPGSPKKSL